MVPRLLFRGRPPDHAQEEGQAQAPAATAGRLPEGAGFSRRDTFPLLCGRPGRSSSMPVGNCRSTLYQAGRTS